MCSFLVGAGSVKQKKKDEYYQESSSDAGKSSLGRTYKFRQQKYGHHADYGRDRADRQTFRDGFLCSGFEQPISGAQIILVAGRSMVPLLGTVATGLRFVCINSRSIYHFETPNAIKRCKMKS